MAFSEIELKHIDNIIGRLCKRRSPPGTPVGSVLVIHIFERKADGF